MQQDNTPREMKGLKLNTHSLMGKQSVRTSFRLPPHIIELLSLVADQLGLKQKSLFDHLVEDKEVLQHVAEKALKYKSEPKDRRQKTFVISRSSLMSLEQVAREHHLPRDLLVEVSIRRLLPVINDEQEKQKKRKLILRDFEDYLRQGKILLQKSAGMLGKEDQVFKRLAELVNLCDKSVAELNEVVEKGKRMEDFF